MHPYSQQARSACQNNAFMVTQGPLELVFQNDTQQNLDFSMWSAATIL